MTFAKPWRPIYSRATVGQATCWRSGRPPQRATTRAVQSRYVAQQAPQHTGQPLPRREQVRGHRVSVQDARSHGELLKLGIANRNVLRMTESKPAMFMNVGPYNDPPLRSK